MQILNWKNLVFMTFLAGLFALQGCDAQRIEDMESGFSTEAEVRAKWGEPERVWEGENGVRIFEYNRQPQGHRNYMISIGPDGKFIGVRQVLNERNFAKVQPGMALEEARKLLGKPGKVVPYDLKKETYYNWRYLANQGNTSMIFSVVVDSEKKIIRTESSPDPESADQRGGSK